MRPCILQKSKGSPIKNAWTILNIYIAEERPQNLDYLKDGLYNIWTNFPQNECLQLGNSMQQGLGKLTMRNYGLALLT